jgi:hypothetical protein
MIVIAEVGNADSDSASDLEYEEIISKRASFIDQAACSVSPVFSRDTHLALLFLTLVGTVVLLFHSVVLDAVHHLSILTHVGIVVFLGCTAIRLRADLVLAFWFHRRRLPLRTCQLSATYVPASDKIRKIKKITRQKKIKRFIRQTPKTIANFVSNGSIVCSWISLLDRESLHASTILSRFVTYFRINYCMYFGTSSLALANALLLTFVCTLPLINANLCTQAKLNVARGYLAAASLPSGLVFFAGGEMPGSVFGTASSSQTLWQWFL